MAVLSILRKRNIAFTVFEDENKLPLYSVLYTDYQYFVEKASRRSDILVIYDPMHRCIELERAILATRFKEEYDEIVFGVDPGSRPSVVVLGDEGLLDYQALYSVKDVVEYIADKTQCYPSKKIVVRIGGGFNGWKIALALKKKLKVRTEVVDEWETTPKNTRLDDILLSSKYLVNLAKHRYRDVYAALKIALRRGIEVD